MPATTPWHDAELRYRNARLAERGHATPDAVSHTTSNERPTRRIVPCDTPHSATTRALALDAYRAWLDIDPDERRRLTLVGRQG